MGQMEITCHQTGHNGTQHRPCATPTEDAEPERSQEPRLKNSLLCDRPGFSHIDQGTEAIKAKEGQRNGSHWRLKNQDKRST